MKRHVYTLLTALSLLLCILALWQWALSLAGTTRLGWVAGGLALAGTGAPDDFMTERSSRDVITLFRNVADESRSVLGFAHDHGTLNNFPFWVVVVPYWFIVLVTAILPVRWWWLRRRRRDRAVSGRCLGCGYDLRGSSGRCPECGLDAATPAPSSIDDGGSNVRWQARYW